MKDVHVASTNADPEEIARALESGKELKDVTTVLLAAIENTESLWNPARN